MFTLTANEAKTNFGKMLLKAQSEPVEINKNGSSVAVVVSIEEYNQMEALKMELIRSRFENINEEDLVDGETFFNELDAETNNK